MYINKSFSNGYTIPKRKYLNTLLVSAWKALLLLIPYTWEAPLLRQPQNRQGRPRRLCENTGRVVERRLSAMRVLWRALPMPRLLGTPLAPMSKAAAGSPPAPPPPGRQLPHPKHPGAPGRQLPPSLEPLLRPADNIILQRL